MELSDGLYWRLSAGRILELEGLESVDLLMGGSVMPPNGAKAGVHIGGGTYDGNCIPPAGPPIGENIFSFEPSHVFGNPRDGLFQDGVSGTVCS